MEERIKELEKQVASLKEDLKIYKCQTGFRMDLIVAEIKKLVEKRGK